MGYRNYGPASGYVVAKDGTGDFSSIGAALTAASSLGGSGTIYIKDGTYTENPALVASWNLVAWSAQALTPTVIINGKCTFSSAGTVSISGIQLQTNSDFFLAITGSASSIVHLKDCFLYALNNTGISYTTSGVNSALSMTDCLGTVQTTGITMWVATGAGAINLVGSHLISATTLASSTSDCPVSLDNSTLGFPLSCSSTGTLNSRNSSIDTGALNAQSITTAGTGSSLFIQTSILSGTASAISVGSGSTFSAANLTVGSSNANAITGAGTLNAGIITFIGVSSTINTSTVNKYTTYGGTII